MIPDTQLRKVVSVELLIIWVILLVVALATIIHGDKIAKLEKRLDNSYAPIITDKSICEFDSDYIPDTGMGVLNP